MAHIVVTVDTQTAKRQILELEQSALFVDSPPLAKAMTDAAKWIREVIGEPEP